MKTMIKKWWRKQSHKRFIDSYINELRWESLNVMITASATQWNDDIVNLLNNNAILIRKYERRRRWVKF